MTSHVHITGLISYLNYEDRDLRRSHEYILAVNPMIAIYCASGLCTAQGYGSPPSLMARARRC